MQAVRSQTLLFFGFTAVLVGYFSVWLPGPAAGLRILGVELGEWIKFMGVGQRRDLFYVPPITLGLALVFFTAGWESRRWQTWAMRFVAVAVSLLAFPAIASILDEAASQWLPRLLLIGLVVVMTLVIGSLGTWNGRPPRVWTALIALAILGFGLPTWAFLTVRPIVSQVMGQEIGIGPGLWLNGMGHLLIAIASVRNMV